MSVIFHVVRGYDHLPGAESCPFCGENHYALVDDGDDVTLQVKCWCGATARVRRDDPDLERLLLRDLGVGP